MDLGVGLIGYGAEGRRRAQAWRLLSLLGLAPCSVRLAGVSEADPMLRRAAVERDGFAWSTEDHDALIGNPEVSVVDIALPLGERTEPLRSALAAGKHILCPAPLTAHLRESEEIAALANRTPGKKQANARLRYTLGLLTARQLVDAGFLGEPVSLHAVLRRAGPAPSEDEGETPNAGDLADVLDVIRALNGEVEEVSASSMAYSIETGESGAGESGEEPVLRNGDSISALLRCQNGSEATLEVSRVPVLPSDEMRLEVFGTAGAFRFDLSRPGTLDILDASGPVVASGWHRLAENSPGLGIYQADVLAMRDFLQSVASDEAPSPSFRDALMAQRIITAIRESAESEWTLVDLGR